MAIPTKCPQCGKGPSWDTSGASNFIPHSEKPERGQKPHITWSRGMFVTLFVCRNCSHVVFVKDVYDKDLV